MTVTCCVPGCKTGYRSNKNPEKIATFQFPKDKNLRQKWIRAIPRKDWIPTNSSRVCAKHFCTNDFLVTSTDNKLKRKNSRTDQKLQRRRLKKAAIPRIFPGLAAYLTSATPATRSANCSSSARIEKINASIENTNNEFLAQDNIETFQMLKDKLKSEVLPTGYDTVMQV